ncbi:MAG: arylamine N-acetyltransferase family protein [Micromonosporaceae bacterium]
MDLTATLARIGYDGPVTPDLATLRAVHRAWLGAVPYENLDIQLGRPISLHPADLVDKLVTRGRGGYCYEMNGTLGLLLEAIGFPVTRVRGGVDRETEGDTAWYNHLALLVEVEGGTWIADAGLGDGSLEPLPLRPGDYQVGPLTFHLERLDDRVGGDVWRIRNDHPAYSVRSFDIDTTPRRIEDFAERNTWQYTSPESSFVKTLVVNRAYADDAAVVRARTLTRYGPAIPGGKQSRLLDDADELGAVLTGEFAVPAAAIEADLATLWRQACEQHAAWQAQQATDLATRTA